MVLKGMPVVCSARNTIGYWYVLGHPVDVTAVAAELRQARAVLLGSARRSAARQASTRSCIENSVLFAGRSTKPIILYYEVRSITCMRTSHNRLPGTSHHLVPGIRVPTRTYGKQSCLVEFFFFFFFF